MVGSLSADNELWLALVLRHPLVQSLNEAELAGLMCGIVIDGYKSSNAYFMHKPSDTMKDVLNGLEPLFWELKSEQGAAGVDFPVYLGAYCCYCYVIIHDMIQFYLIPCIYINYIKTISRTRMIIKMATQTQSDMATI